MYGIMLYMDKKLKQVVKTKAVKKAPVKKVELYKMELHYNGEDFSAEGDDLATLLKGMQPVVLKTHIKMKITKGKLTCEKLILLNKAKKMYRSEILIEFAVNRLIFK